VAIDAVKDKVFALVEFLVLFVVADEPPAGIYLFFRAAAVTLAAALSIADNLHMYTVGIHDVVAAGAVTFLTLDTRFSPGADEAGKAILVADRAVAGGMAVAAGIGFFFSSKIWDPVPAHAQQSVLQVVLGGRVFIAGDDITLRIDEERLPVIPADHVADIIPGIVIRGIGDLAEGVLRGLPIHHRIKLVRMSGLNEVGIDFLMAGCAGLRADEIRSRRGRFTGRASRTLGARRTSRSHGTRFSIPTPTPSQKQSD
jgi:hypothetical protein